MSAVATVAKKVYESRAATRVKIATPFLLRYEKSAPFEYETVMTENVSKTGLCITTKNSIPVQTKVYLETPNHRFRALAVVVYTNKTRIGLHLLASKGAWLVK